MSLRAGGLATNMTQVQGTVAPGFEDVRERFAASVEAESAQYGDPGAQLSVRVHGRPVVDLWSEGLPGDALTGVFSVAKGASHLTVALLVRDGVLSLDQPAWGLTLREVLGHRAGLIAADGGFTPEEAADDRLLAERLSRQKPFWTPGAAYGYHALTVAALTGAVVREATGRSLQDIYAERIRAPYGLELYLGLPEELEPRYREVLPFPEPLPPGDPESLMAKAFTPPQGGLDAFINTRAARAGGQGSAGGVGNARGVAGLYAAALTLLDEQTAAEFARLSSPGTDLVTGEEDHFGLGFERVSAKYPYLGDDAFGHGGAAGSMGWADPSTGVAYGYVRRRMAWPPGGGAAENVPLGEAVIAAARAFAGR